MLPALKRIALAFHLHQPTGPGIRAAALASYRPLIELLRDHPTVPVHLHVSGSLLAGLAWYAPDLIDLIRQGAVAGQFEILGSTYAQSVPEAAPASSELALAAHREQLERALNARPVGFFSPGRAWCDALLPLVAQARFRYMLVDSEVLAAGGLAATQLVRVPVEGAGSLFLVPDAARLRACVNLAIWSGERRPLEEYVAALPGGATVAYAEDAGAVGLWAHHHGRACAPDREHLAQVLSWLQRADGVQAVHLGRLVEAAPEPGDLVRFSAAARGGEVGTPTIQHYHKLFDAIARAFTAAAGVLGASAPAGARRLFERGREMFAACQLELGMAGAGEARRPAWELARTSLLLLEAAVRAAASESDHAPARSAEADRDHDGVKEIYLQVGGELAILAPVGGRVLVWIDLHSGEVLGGCALADVPAPFASAAHPYAGPVAIPPAPAPGSPAGRVELPAAEAWFGPLLAAHPDLARLRVAEAPLARPPEPRRHAALRRVGLFADALDGALLTDAWPHEIASGEVRFQTPWGAKVIKLVSGRLSADYPAGYGGGAALTVRCELLPDRRHRPALSAPPLRADAGDAPLAVEVASAPEAALASWEEHPLAWVAGLSFQRLGTAPLPALRVEVTRHP